MKFKPTEKEDWIESIKLNQDYQSFSNEELSAIYATMVEEANKGMIAAAALGGKWEQGEPDYSLLKTFKQKKISNDPTNNIAQVLKGLYAEYKKNLLNMFNDSKADLSITPQQVVEALYHHGLENYATQIYILFGGMYAGCAYNINTVIQEVKGLVAAYHMAEDLNVEVSEIEPQKALEYYQTKNHES